MQKVEDKYKGEKVLVINKTLFEKLGTFQGTNKDTSMFDQLVKPENNFFKLRMDAEEDTSKKQLIPYCIFKYKNTFLQYNREKSGGEGRLHGKASIGIGGHINPIDSQDTNMGIETYKNGLRREIEEELNIEGDYTINTLGLVNDDSNSVGAVHLGVIHIVELENNNVTSNEDSIANIKFLSVDQLKENKNNLETWSQFAIDLL